MTVTATVPTEHASRYLQQLSKHWSHKFDVNFDAHKSAIAFPMGALRMEAQADALRGVRDILSVLPTAEIEAEPEPLVDASNADRRDAAAEARHASVCHHRFHTRHRYCCCCCAASSQSWL